jgi:hypothetical protein
MMFDRAMAGDRTIEVEFLIFPKKSGTGNISLKAEKVIRMPGNFFDMWVREPKR